MMIKLTFNTWEETLEFAKKIVAEAPKTVAEAPKTVAEAPKTVAEAAAPVPTQAPEPVPAPAPAPAPAPTPEPKKITKQDVQTKAIQLMDAGRQDQLQALLAKYNVPALPSLVDEQLAGFYADMEAL